MPVERALWDMEAVAANQADQVLGGTGAVGDYLYKVIVVPASVDAKAVAIKDGSGSAVTIFAGGTASLTDLKPFEVLLELPSASGAWKITTNTAVSAIGIGTFT